MVKMGIAAIVLFQLHDEETQTQMQNYKPCTYHLCEGMVRRATIEGKRGRQNSTFSPKLVSLLQVVWPSNIVLKDIQRF